MNLVNRKGQRVTIRQLPVALLLIAGFFSFPFLAFSSSQFIAGTDADGKIFCLLFGVLILWLFLEFVATRERLEVDLETRILTRSVNGVFKRKKQVIDLKKITAIGVEVRMDPRGTRRRLRQYLYLYGEGENFLINSPSKLYLDHAKLGRLFSQIALIPYRESTSSGASRTDLSRPPQ